jgi:peroxiredoxin
MTIERRGRCAVPAAVFLAGGIVLLWGGAAWARDPAFENMEVAHASTPAAAPEFTLPTPDGKKVSLAQLRGQVVFVNFWATWCPPCRVEMPSMERLHQQFKGRGLAMLAIDIGESPKQVARFMKEFRLSFPALVDADSTVASRYGVQGSPVTVLIDRNGRVVGRAVGPRDWASPEGQALVRSLLERR